MLRLQTPDLADRGQSDGAHQAAADDMVPRRLPDQPGQDLPVRAGAPAPLGCQLSHSVAALHQEINRAMAKQDSTHRLDGTVQLDDSSLGGARAGGKPGRGSENKVPFVAAVSRNEAGHPMHIKLNLVSGFTRTAIGTRINALEKNLLPRNSLQFNCEEQAFENISGRLARRLSFDKFSTILSD
jgi:hypothetical protein